jgi:hypothetical protein
VAPLPRLCPSTRRTSANINVSNSLPNGLHFKIDDAFELLTSDTQFVPGLTQTALNTGESYFAHFDRQLGYLHANALCLGPASTCNRIDILGHLVLPRSRTMVLGRVARLSGSQAHSSRRTNAPGVSAMPRSARFVRRGIEIRLSPRLRHTAALRRPSIAPQAGALDVSVSYLSVDNEIDAERCRISLREKSPITLFALGGAGRASFLTGVVQSIRPEPNCAGSRRWLVEMDVLTVASVDDRRRKARQRAP